MNNILSTIKKDKQIIKFCFYGFFKNLKFFEPYFLIYLMNRNLNLFQIGLLISIRELITYVFEIPSGIFADTYGRKNELMICFTFYIISFILFFTGYNFVIISIAMIFFGLGEAFRSGTHKAMIYSYLEQKNWFNYKTFVYGRTRSYSLLGSALSSFLSIIFILILKDIQILFLIGIIPYLLDFWLIYTYPNSLDEKCHDKFNILEFCKLSITQLKYIFKNKYLLKLITNTSFFDAEIKCIKDYIQPILLQITLFSTVLSSTNYLLNNLTTNDKTNIALGSIYCILNLLSSLSSKNIYRLKKYFSTTLLLNSSFYIISLIFIGLSLSISNNKIIIIFIIYIIIYLIKDSRRPLFVDLCGDNMEKNQRATVLSIESQFKALFSIILAPILGLIADTWSLSILFIILSIITLLVGIFLKLKNNYLEV